VNRRHTDNIGDQVVHHSPVLMGSLVVILLVCSWLDHQCCPCVFCSPFPSFDGVPGGYSFSLLSSQEQTKRITNRDPIKTGEGWTEDTQTTLDHQCCLCVFCSPFPSLDGVPVGYSFSLFLTWSPMLSVCLLFTLPQFLMGSVLFILKIGEGWTEDTQTTLVIKSRTN
jgi:hypothetical protein